MQRKHLPWAALGLVAAIVLTACGGGGEEPAATGSNGPVTAGPDPTPQPVPEPTPEPAPEPPAPVPPVLAALPESTATRYTTAAGAAKTVAEKIQARTNRLQIN